MTKITAPLTLMGAPGSPYTRKMLAVLRYRRIPYELLIGGFRNPRPRLPKPKVALLPTFYLPGDDGELEAVTDSTPLIRRFEAAFEGRSIIPTDPALAFLDYLLEDYADEWLTKAMFHYRWHYQADIDKAAEILPRWTVEPNTDEALAPISKMIGERQISRLYVVGSNDTTAPVIEASYERYLDAMAAHLEKHAFLFGARPSSADFAAYGQLTQLVGFDPTPAAVTLARAPRVYAWVDVVDDLSGLEAVDDQWLDPKAIPQSLSDLFTEVGRVYVPAMLANEQAIAAGSEMVECEIDNRPWVQKPFPYQAKCLGWVRTQYAALDDDARAIVNGVLDGTGCEKLLT